MTDFDEELRKLLSDPPPSPTGAMNIHQMAQATLPMATQAAIMRTQLITGGFTQVEAFELTRDFFNATLDAVMIHRAVANTDEDTEA